MRVLLDECLPGRKLKPGFPNHDVRTVADMDWRGIRNGVLLALAEPEFDAFVTLDRGIEYQQDLTGLSVRIVIVRAYSNKLADLLPLVPSIQTAIERLAPGALVHVAG